MIENELAAEASAKGKYLLEKIGNKELKMVREIRHIGLMIGIELRKKPKPYILKLMEKEFSRFPEVQPK